MEWWEIIHKDPLYPLPSYSNDNISHNYGMYHNEENEFDITYIPYLEKEMATHSSILAWRNPWTEEPGGLLSRGSHRVGHDWSDSSSSSCIHPMHFTTVVHMGVQFCVIWSCVNLYEHHKTQRCKYGFITGSLYHFFTDMATSLLPVSSLNPGNH